MPPNSTPDCLLSLTLPSKQVSLETLSTLLSHLQRSSSSMTIHQKSILISNLARTLHLATHNWLAEVRRVRDMVCYIPGSKRQEKTNEKRTTHHKKNKEIVKNKGDTQKLTIDQILEQVEEQNRALVEPSPDRTMQTPIKAGQYSEKQN